MLIAGQIQREVRCENPFYCPSRCFQALNMILRKHELKPSVAFCPDLLEWFPSFGVMFTPPAGPRSKPTKALPPFIFVYNLGASIKMENAKGEWSALSPPYFFF